MEFRNLTPFPSLSFKALGTDDAYYHVVVTRISYNLTATTVNTYVMELAEEQSPLVLEDQYYGAINKSSVRCESDLAPFKPKCDLLLTNARAHAPSGKAVPSFYCLLRAGNTEKMLRVTGPRIWQRRLMRWVLLPPEPTEMVPMQYEYAYGGECLHTWPAWRNKAPFHEVYTQNPVGKGWMPREHPLFQSLQEIQAPQIESPSQPIENMGGDYTPQGFGAVGRPWTPRIQLAGSYDDTWKKERWPKSPIDFQDAYWNCAPPDLQIDYPQPNMPLELRGFTQEGILNTALPGHRCIVAARFTQGPILPLKTVIDTLLIDPQAFKVTVVWRARVPATPDIRVLEARFEMNPHAPLLQLAMASPSSK